MNQDHDLSRLASELVAESACELRADSGELVEIWLIDAAGPLVTASAPRLKVQSGMRFTWRRQNLDAPMAVTLVVEEATYQSQHRARLRLRVDSVHADGARRRHGRHGIAVQATLTAISCDRVVDHDIVSGTVVDLSQHGIGIRTADHRPRPGDRYRLDMHSLGGHLQTDIRIKHISRHPDSNHLGCSIIDTDTGAHASHQIAAILARIANADAA